MSQEELSPDPKALDATKDQNPADEKSENEVNEEPSEEKSEETIYEDQPQDHSEDLPKEEVKESEKKVEDNKEDRKPEEKPEESTESKEKETAPDEKRKEVKGKRKKVKDKMPIKERYAGVIETFLKEMPSPETELNYRNPYELLVAVVLSAQCTDKRINIVTPPFFEKYPNATELAKASFDDIHEFIKSVTFPNNKTKALMGLAQTLVEKYGGEVPEDIDSLLTLPGVGRKSANVILNVIYGKAVMPVDTHVFRVSERLGLTTKSPTPLATEKVLMKHIPEEHVQQAHHWLILHGRYVCKARKPECEECYLKKYCRLFKEEGENMMAQTLKKDAKKDNSKGKDTKAKDSKKETTKDSKKEAPKKETSKEPKKKADNKAATAKTPNNPKKEAQPKAEANHVDKGAEDSIS